jgi:hypothetical protein
MYMRDKERIVGWAGRTWGTCNGREANGLPIAPGSATAYWASAAETLRGICRGVRTQSERRFQRIVERSIACRQSSS